MVSWLGMTNPLLSLARPIAFPAVTAEHLSAVRQHIADADARLSAITAGSPSYASTLGAMEAATEPLELCVGILEHLEGVATTPAFRDAYNALQPEITAFWASVYLRENLFQALVAFSETDEAKGLDPTRKRYLDKTLADFKRQALLDAEGKAKLTAVEQKLGLVSDAILSERPRRHQRLRARARGRDAAPGLARIGPRAPARERHRQGPRRLPADAARAGAHVHPHVRRRRRAAKGHLSREQHARAASGQFDNRPLIAELLELRRERARLLGFRTFADLVTEDRMAASGAEAQRFVRDLTDKTRAAFEREQEELLAFRRKLEGPAAPALEPWDVPYYADKLRRERYDLDEEQLRPYFEAGRVLNGAFQLAERLFGVTIEPTELPTWDPRVKTSPHARRRQTGARRAFTSICFPGKISAAGPGCTGLSRPSHPSRTWRSSAPT